jgi:type III secretion system YscQ/HrcQ family protein
MAKKLRKFRWSNLPRLTRQGVSIMNGLLAHLPQTPFERGFKDRLRAVLEPALHADLDVWLTGIDVVSGASIGQRLADPCCAAVIGLAGRSEKGLLEVDLASAQTAIDRLLGGDGADVDQTRPLSEIEEGVFTFVLLKFLAIVHETFGGERQWGLKLEGLHGSLEALQGRVDLDGDFAVLGFKLFVDSHVGVARFYLPASLVRTEFAPSWPSHGPALERLLFSYADRKEMVRLLRAPLRVEVGRLSLAMNDLDGLEADDIVLVEQTDARIMRDDPEDDEAPSYLSGQVTCHVGDGAHGSIVGSVAVGANGRYEVAIESIVPLGEPRAMGMLFPAHEGGMDEPMAEDARRLNRLSVDTVDSAALAAAGRVDAATAALAGAPRAMATGAGNDADRAAEHSDGYEEDDDAEAPSPEAAGLLDDVTVAMVVELGRVMVSAADVMGLRAGQVIELSRAPGEPVDLVVDGKRIGKGELVEIDGELGVRILSLSR